MIEIENIEKNKFFLKNGLCDQLLDLIGISVDEQLSNNTYYYFFNGRPHPTWGEYDFRLFNFNFNIVNKSLGKDTSGNWLLNRYGLPAIAYSPKKIIDKFNNIDKEYIIKLYKQIKEKIKFSDIITNNRILNIDKAYGIHLRSGDKITNDGDTYNFTTEQELDIIISNLLQYIEKIIKSENNPYFYIASHDKLWKNKIENDILKISKKYNNSIFILKVNETKLDYIYSNYLSVLDLYHLSCCKEVLMGVGFSTYSICASLLNEKPLIYFLSNEHLNKKYMYLWKDILNIKYYQNKNGIL